MADSAGYHIDYTALGLSEEQYQAYKNAFLQLDKTKLGAITPNQLETLSYNLGEVFDEEELQVAIASLENPETGLIHFPTFLSWWTSE